MSINKVNRIVLTTDSRGAIRANLMHDTQVMVSYVVYNMSELVQFINDNNFTRLVRGIYVR